MYGIFIQDILTLFDEPVTKKVIKKAINYSTNSGQTIIIEFLVNKAKSQGLDLESGELAIFGDYLRKKECEGNYTYLTPSKK